MSGAIRPFRVMKRRATGILSPDEEMLWDNECEKFRTMIYEGLDHDL
jgi:hypothetical protein